MYQAEGVKQGETRTDQISTETIREYVKGKVKADVESKVQFAFSNSSQTLDIDPKTATLALTMYDGGVALDKKRAYSIYLRRASKTYLLYFRRGNK